MTWAPYLDFMDAEGANLGPQVCAANIYTWKHLLIIIPKVIPIYLAGNTDSSKHP